MPNSYRFHLTSFAVVFIAALMISSSTTAVASDDNWMPMKPACTGSIADCMGRDEFVMDSESNRRILATTDYISYDALRRNSVPCDQRGASYYNCEKGAEANPYDRGCSAITRCRS